MTRTCKCGKALIYIYGNTCKSCKAKRSYKGNIRKKTIDRDEGLKSYQKHGVSKSYAEYVEEDKKINPNHHNNKYF